MSIVQGQNGNASDFVNESERNAVKSNDAGKGVKLEADGYLHRNFLYRTAQARLTLSADFVVAGDAIPWDTEDYDDGTDALHSTTAPYDTYNVTSNAFTANSSNTEWYAQKIVTGASDRLIDRVKLYMQSTGGATSIYIKIRSTLTGADLYSSGAQGGGAAAWLTFDNIGLAVSPNTTYYIIVLRAAGMYNYQVGYNSTAPYASGGFYSSSDSGSSWSGEDTAKDMALEVQIDNRAFVIVQQAGYYLVTAQLPTKADTGSKSATLYKNSTVIGFGQSTISNVEEESVELLTIVKCAANDILYIVATATSGPPTISASGASFCVFRLA